MNGNNNSTGWRSYKFHVGFSDKMKILAIYLFIYSWMRARMCMRRFYSHEGAEEVYVQLIGARARAAPMEITIPRLELLAAIGNIGCGIRSKMLRI